MVYVNRVIRINKGANSPSLSKKNIDCSFREILVKKILQTKDPFVFTANRYLISI